MDQSFLFDSTQFNRLFPFYILVDKDLKISATGTSIKKLCDIKKGEFFNKHFSIPRPHTLNFAFNDLISLQNQLIILEFSSKGKIKLRGQFEYLSDINELLFIGSPWFDSMEQLQEENLVLHDFAYHDSLIDLLQVLKTQEITNEDLKRLIATINKQKEDLKETNKKFQDIAIFPTKNPDPLIRINFDGDVLTNNPVAALLDFFEFENNTIRNDEFFKIIAERIDKTIPRWTIEAEANSRQYSFVCVPLIEEGYINIYGRDITEKKKIENEITRLSLVASLNKNGVVFVNLKGVITWANKAFCTLTGYSINEVIGKSPIELYTGKLTDKFTLAKIRQDFFKGEEFNSNIIYYRKDNTWFWGNSQIQAIRNEKGDITEFFGFVQDVTTEISIQEKMKVLSQIAEDNINGVIIADAQGKITWVNKSFTKMTGYTLDEAIGKKPGHLLQGPETDRKTVNYLAKQISNGNPFNAEILNYHKNGNKYWLRVQGQAIKNEKNEITGFFGLEEDITNEKESEQRIRKVLEYIGDNVWEHDFRTGQTYFSKSSNELLGYTTDEMTNNQKLWWSKVYKKDYSILEENDKKYRQKEINSHNLEYRMVHKNGSIRWVLDRGVVIEKDINGFPVKITGTHTDITERKLFEKTLEANEEKYRSILENMNVGLMELTMNEEITYANKTLADMVSIPYEDIIGTNALLFLNYEGQELIKAKEIERRNGKTEAYEIKVNIKGNEKWWLVSAAPKYSESNNYIGSTIISLDISDRKELEKELITAREKAEELAKTKEIFLANMSHEIRTPMNAIMGMSSQLAKTDLTEKQRFFLETIHSASDNLLVIINDILDLSKIEAGKLSLENIGFEPKLVVGHAMQVLMHKAEEKGLLLTNSYCDTRLSPVLLGDPYRLNQILLNLINNAIKFTEKGSVDVSFEVLKDSSESQLVRARVTDTGIGMEKEFLNRLFENFSQEYESVSRKYGGTGLGMSICRDLVKLMKGEIEVKSEKGKGTIVQFEIEFKKGRIDDLPTIRSSEITKSFLNEKTILVADDNEMNRLVASTILDNYGAKTIEASNGEEAIQAVEKSKPDLVLMDIQMPVMNGYEATKEIRGKGYKTPIIALTANAIKGENEKCLAVGMNDYISKPFEEEAFLKVIAHWLDGEIINQESNNSQFKAQTLSDVSFDLTELKNISHGNTVFIKKMLELFINQAPSTVEEIILSYNNSDFEKVKKLAHRFKPSIDNLGINSIKSEIREIEKNAIEYGKSKQLNELINKVDIVIKKVVSDLNDYLNKM